MPENQLHGMSVTPTFTFILIF